MAVVLVRWIPFNRRPLTLMLIERRPKGAISNASEHYLCLRLLSAGNMRTLRRPV